MLINNYLPKILYLTLLEFIHPLNNMSLELYACLCSNTWCLQELRLSSTFSEDKDEESKIFHMDYVSTVVKKTSAVLQTERNIIIYRRK